MVRAEVIHLIFLYEKVFIVCCSIFYAANGSFCPNEF